MPEPTVVSIPLAGAVDEQTARQYLDPTKRAVSVVNGLIYKEGAVDKRLGLSLVPQQNDPGISKAVRLVPWTKGPQQFVAWQSEERTRAALWDWSAVADATVSEAGTVTWKSGPVQVSELPNVAVRRTPVITNPSPEAPWILDIPVKTQYNMYTGVTLRLTLFRELPSYDLYATVTDLSTGQVVLHKTLVYANRGTSGEATAPYPVALFTGVEARPGEDVQIIVQDNSFPSPGFVNQVFLINYDYVTNRMRDPVFLATARGQGTLGLSDAAPYAGAPNGYFLLMTCQTSFGNEVHLSVFDSTGGLRSDRVMPMPAGQRAQNGFAIEGTWGGKCHFFCVGLDGSNQYHMLMFQTEGDELLTPDPGVAQPWEYDNTGNVSAVPSGCCRIAEGQTWVHIVATVRPSPDSAILTQTGSWFNLNDVNDYVGTGHTPFGYVPVAKPFVVGGHVYEANYFELILQAGSGAAVDRSEQITLYLQRYSRLQEFNALDPAKVNDYNLPVACSAPRLVDAGAGYLTGFALNKKPYMSQFAPPPSPFARQRYGFGLRTRGSGTPALVNRVGPSWCTDFYFDEEVGSLLSEQYQPTELLGELGLSGGVQFVSDGLQATEDSFFSYPEFAYASLESPNTRPLEGQYIYAVCYSYVDAAGLVHRSVPAFTNPVTCTTYETDPPFGLAPRLHIPVLSATWRDVQNPRQVYAEIYRTESDGSVFYFLDRVRASGRAWNDYEVEWPSDSSTDQTTDEVLRTASLLYTTGNGELDNVNPPASFLSIVHKDRRAIVDETGLNVWFTKQASSPTLAPGWNEGLQVAFPEGGQITALASMDGTFVVFKRNSVWKLYGSGPPNNGQSSDWTVPEAVVADVGAVSWRSLAEVPMGFVFQAVTGFHLLTRSLTVEYIGQDVQDKIRDYPEVVKATVVTTNSSKHVRWTCKNSSGRYVVIVWDYDHRTWSFFEYPYVDSVADTAMVVQHGDVAASYCVLGATGDAAGRTWAENSRADIAVTSNYPVWKDEDLDGETHFIPTVVQVAGVRLGVQAGQRTRVVQLLADRLDACGLRMDLAFDGSEEASQTERWESLQLRQLPVSGQVQVNVAAAFTRSQSVEVTLSDFEGSPSGDFSVTGQGARFVNLTFELESLGQRWKQVPALGRR